MGRRRPRGQHRTLHLRSSDRADRGAAIGFSNDHDAGSALGGGQIGVNFQFGGFVFGVEADGIAHAMSRRNLVGLAFPGFGPAPPVPFVREDNFDWRFSEQYSVRGRLGFAWDRFLIYGTGGVAFAQVSLESNFPAVGLFPATRTSQAKTFTGWTVGVGGEWAVTDYASLGLEYRYSDYGRQTYSSGLVAGGATPIIGAAVVNILTFTPATSRIDMNSHEVMFKVNFRPGKIFGLSWL
jgi:outer membrane immunogenic protein